MQVRVFREDDGKFTVVCSPRRRTGLVPVATKSQSKAEVLAVVQATSEAEMTILGVIRAARRKSAPV